MPVIRTTRFEVAPRDVKEMIARRNALVAAVRHAFPGLTEAGPAFALAGNATAETAEIVDER